MIQSLFQFIRLYLFFALLFASFLCTMSSTNDISVAPESAETKRVTEGFDEAFVNPEVSS